MSEIFMSMWVIYDHPRDFPDKFVARRHDIFRDIAKPTIGSPDDFFTADSLEEVRKMIPPGLYCLSRQENDEPQIVEVWL